MDLAFAWMLPFLRVARDCLGTAMFLLPLLKDVMALSTGTTTTVAAASKDLAAASEPRWTIEAMTEFASVVLGGLLSSRVQFDLDVEMEDIIAVYCLKHSRGYNNNGGGGGKSSSSNSSIAPPVGGCGGCNGGDLVLTQAVSEFISSDVDALESRYQDLYRHGSSSGKMPLLEMRWGMWQTLCTISVESHMPLFRHLLFEFSRIPLLNIVCVASDGSQLADYVECAGNFNRGLGMMWKALEYALEAPSRGTGGPSIVHLIGANILFCMVSPSKIVSSLAFSESQRCFKVSGSLAVLDLLAHKNKSDFWSSFLTILDAFRDHCSLGPPLLICAERIQYIMADILRLALPSWNTTRNYEISISELWIKSWPFLEALLSSSVTWAKLDPAHKNSVKTIANQSFALITLLTKHCGVISASSSAKSSATKPVLSCFPSVMQWLRSLSNEIRGEAVSALVSMIHACSRTGIMLSPSVKEQLENCCNGTQKTHLTADEKDKIQRAMMPSSVNVLAKRKVPVDDGSCSIVEHNKMPRRDSLDEGTSHSSAEYGKGDTYNANKSSSSTAVSSKWPLTKEPIVLLHPYSAKPFPLLKPLVKSSGSGSKLSQMRAEHSMDLKLNTPLDLSNRRLRRNSSPLDDDDEPPITFKTLAVEEISPDKRPKRSIQLIGDDNKILDPKEKKRAIVSSREPLRRPSRPARNINDLYKLFLTWEIDADGELPPNFEFELREIPERFETVQEYGDFFEPLLLLECWEQFKTSRENVDFSKTGIWTIENCLMLDEFHDLTFVQPVEECRNFSFCDSDLVYLEQSTTVTAAVPHGQCGIGMPRNSKSTKSTLAKIQSISFKSGEATIVARVYLHGRTNLISAFFPNSRWSVVKLLSLTTLLREYTALTLLPKFLLSKEILSPSPQIKFKLDKAAVDRVIRTFKVNQPQGEAIVTATQKTSGFILIQGPPGTGKTKTILGLVGSLLTTASNPIRLPGAKAAPTIGSKKTRLMVCAPSNAACDEIVRRLKNGIQDAQGKPFTPKIVRLGTSESIGSDVRDVTLEEILKGQLETDQEYLRRKSSKESFEGQWIALQKHESELKQEREALRAKEKKEGISSEDATLINTKISGVTTKLKTIDEKIKALKAKRRDADNISENVRSRLKLKILTDAEVIMCTLSGAGHEILSNIQGFEFPTVIIDEACQSIEMSSLIPLRYNVKKCILVGDPKQLPPTVLSPIAQRYSYEQSLFQRIMSFHRDNVCLLSIQYRMHPNISKFPSRQFYESRLGDADNLTSLCKAPWHVKYPPYQFFNVAWGREQRVKHSLYNPDEILACVNFVQQLCADFPSIGFASKIGVITPYKGQMFKLRDKFKERFGDDILKMVDINTVDAFQGQEKHIIILSTVRAGLGQAIGFLRDKRRMNVALTRAKFSLYVFGRSLSLCNNDDWRALVEDSQARNSYVELDQSTYGSSSLHISTPNIFKK